MTDTFAPDILVIGGAHIDRIGRSTARLEPGQSNPGSLKRNIGGVAGNIAQALARLEWNIALSTITGQDADAELLREKLLDVGVDLSLITTSAKKTSASYTAIEDRNGSLIAAIADMSVYDSYPPEEIHGCLSAIPEQSILVADTNLPPAALEELAANKGKHKLAICAVSGPKANRAASLLSHIDLLFCNEAEAAILAQEYADATAVPGILMEEGVKSGVITRGDAGITAWLGEEIWHLPAPPVKIKSTNGAGDCLTACILHGLLLDKPFPEALTYGMAGASLALMSDQAVPDLLNRSMLDSCLADIPTR